MPSFPPAPCAVASSFCLATTGFSVCVCTFCAVKVKCSFMAFLASLLAFSSKNLEDMNLTCSSNSAIDSSSSRICGVIPAIICLCSSSIASNIAEPLTTTGNASFKSSCNPKFLAVILISSLISMPVKISCNISGLDCAKPLIV